VLLRLEPEAIARLGTGLEGGTTVVSATNGKTTTAGMIAAILAADGRHPVHNRAGSNMTWGVATALLEQRGTEGLFEVDEAWLPRVTEQLEPSLIVLGNLFRDQLDRYGEMEALADEWAKTVASRVGGTQFALNADDPLIADLGRDAEGERREEVVYFGIEDPSQALPELQHAFDAKHCRRCGHPYTYERAFVGHLGHYSCPNCGAERPQPEVAATAIELRGMEGSRSMVRVPGGEIELELPLPGLYNVYNALAAIAAGLRLGVAPERIAAALGEMRAAFGRVETIPVGDASVSILLIKNPAGANEVLRTLLLEAHEREPIDLWIALNDGIADGRDVSWIWDADFELLDGAVRRVVCSGTRAPEMALRLKYAGWPEEAIEVVPGIEASLDAAVAGSETRLFALPTYTALLELRKLLADRGLAREFWR
jgi:UDP-N-acetylmuramyl tripeptide synthase